MIGQFSAVLSRTCACGRSYDDAGGFTRHQHVCPRGKKRLSNALEAAKASYRKKKARVHASDLEPVESQQSHVVDSRPCGMDSDARFAGNLNDGRSDVSFTSTRNQKLHLSFHPRVHPSSVPTISHSRLLLQKWTTPFLCHCVAPVENNVSPNVFGTCSLSDPCHCLLPRLRSLARSYHEDNNFNSSRRRRHFQWRSRLKSTRLDQILLASYDATTTILYRLTTLRITLAKTRFRHMTKSVNST